jgi:hypothetical protein
MLRVGGSDACGSRVGECQLDGVLQGKRFGGGLHSREKAQPDKQSATAQTNPIAMFHCVTLVSGRWSVGGRQKPDRIRCGVDSITWEDSRGGMSAFGRSAPGFSPTDAIV